MTRPHRVDPSSMQRRGSPWRTSVTAGLVSLMMLSGIAGCGDQPRAGPVATDGSIPVASPTGPGATPDVASAEAPVLTPLGATSSTAGSTAVAVTQSAGDPGLAAVALSALAQLDVRTADPQMGYRRDLFGQAWSDDVTVEGGHNGCDTRNDILRRDLASVQIKVGTNGCVVLTGTLDDPYSAQTIAFVRGAATSDAVQIDHLVALSDAWRSGAQLLTADQRQDLANDPLNLLAVSGPLNQAKGDSDAASWLPPNAAFRCSYVIRQIQVKTRYGLWVESAEYDAMARILTDCGDPEAAPVSTPAAPALSTPGGDPAPTTPVEQPAVVVQITSGSAFFQELRGGTRGRRGPAAAGTARVLRFHGRRPGRRCLRELIVYSGCSNVDASASTVTRPTTTYA